MLDDKITEALKHTDCLILPGLGAFVAQYEPARISIANNKITPPSKKIIFNDRIKFDGVQFFAKWISFSEKIPLEEAQKALHEYIENILTILKNVKHYTLSQIGKLVVHDDGSITFEQFEKVNLLKESFGLPDLYFKPIDRGNKESDILSTLEKPHKTMNTNKSTPAINEENWEEEAHYEKEKELDELQVKKTGGLGLYYVAAFAALLLTLSTVYYLYMDKETYAIGSFSPLELLGISKYKNKADIDDNKLLPTEDSEFAANTPEKYVPSADFHEVNEEPEVVKNPNSKPIQIYDLITEKTGNYYVIAGSFKNPQKAVQYRKELESEGLRVYILYPNDGKRMYKVAIESFDDYGEAKSRKEELMTNYGDALWVFNY